MEKIFGKWYFGLVIIPIIINLLTGYFSLPDLLNNWSFTIIITLIITCFILVFEIYELKKENTSLKLKPKKSDKKIVKELLETLDIISFQDKICEQSCWYGYEKSAIHSANDFCIKVSLLKYQTSDEKLNTMLLELKQNIDLFNSLASPILFSDDQYYYSPDKNTDYNIQRTKEIYPLVDEKSKEALKKLNELLMFLKKRNYLE
jgi:hypothetical protein